MTPCSVVSRVAGVALQVAATLTFEVAMVGVGVATAADEWLARRA